MPWKLALRDFRAALFDVDGTLVDSMGMLINGLGDSIERIAGARPDVETIRSLVGLPLTVQLPRYFPEPPTLEQLDEAVRYTIERYEAHEHLERTFEPAIEALRFCKESGIKTALVTSKNSREANSFMNRFVASDAVDLVVCSDDVARPKPHPDAAQLACKEFGVSSDEAVFIGDAVFDIECAHAAGVKAVAVAYGAISEDVLAKHSPAMILSSPEELLDWCKSSFYHQPCPAKSH